MQGNDLSEAAASDLLVALAQGEPSPVVAGAMLAALRMKGETPEEIRGFATAMRRLARRPDLPTGAKAVDIVGTGGDGSGSLNLSTGAALLAAACGLPVVKHGNRSISSKSGSADVLEALGVPMPLDEEAAGECFKSTGFTFLFAPYYHPAMKALAPVRRSLGVRTAFNLLGPLTNPAEPLFYVIGAFSEHAAALLAGALAGLPLRRAFVVHGAQDWDEATPIGPFTLFDVQPGRVTRSERDPVDCGLPRCTPADLVGGEAFENAASIRGVFDGERGPRRDALALGAALALEVMGTVSTLGEGLQQAFGAIDSGRASTLLRRITEAFPAMPTERQRCAV
jgi:anthranilate phosphoribosyltransferase